MDSTRMLLLLSGYAAVSITGFLVTVYLDASLYIKARRNNTLKDLYNSNNRNLYKHFEQSGLTKMSDLELAMYGAYTNFGGKVLVWAFWPITLVYLAVPYLAYTLT